MDRNKKKPKDESKKNDNWRNRSHRPQSNQSRNPSFDVKNTWKNNSSSSNRPQNPENKHVWNKHPRGSSFSKQSDQKQGNKMADRHDISFFNRKYLIELCSVSSEKAMSEVAKNESEFAKFLNEEMSPDTLVMTLRALTNVCRANFTAIMIGILNQACSDGFLKNLENYVLKLPFESQTEKIHNQLYHEKVDGFWLNLVEFCQKVIQIMPRTASNKLTSVLKKVEVIIPSIESLQKYKIVDSVMIDLKTMIADLEKEIQKIENISTAVRGEQEEPEPLQSFRSLSVIPTLEDLFDDKPFLRKSKVKEAYASVEQYLDINFRLLKEDFVRPLRNGIKEYLEGARKNRNSDLRVYRNAKLINFEVSEIGSGIRLYFGKLNFVDWRHSKRLIYGGLLLLSKDNFRTIIFATVSNRDEKGLLEGYIMIEPCKGTIIGPDMYNCNVVMLESKVYFEPYYAVLTAMKNIFDKHFPMEKYFIKNEISTELPLYLKDKNSLKFQNKFLLPVQSDIDWPKAYLKNLISSKLPQHLKDRNFLRFQDEYLLPIQSHVDWPKAIDLNMDESQFQAFKSALTEEVSLIQGPPGTGKTFLALQIVKTLLKNKTTWREYGPIVIICLTNHALDSFLEPITKYTQSILRAGSRSKSENLKSYSIVERKKLFSGLSGNRLMFSLKNEVEEVLTKINRLHLFIKYLTEPNSIVPLEVLQNCNDKSLLQKFSSTENLVCRLLGMQLSFPIEEPTLEETSNEMKKLKRTETSYFHDENYDTDADLVFDYAKLKAKASKGPILPLDIIDREINFVRNQIQLLSADCATSTMPYSPLFQWKKSLQMLIKKREIIRRELMNHPITNQSNAQSNHYFWRNYWQWVKNSYDYIQKRIHDLEIKYRELNIKLNEAKHIADLEIMKEHEIVGLTTTCAAKMQSSLRALRAPIVVVEEAAEILEAHVVCALTKDCQQVILIGDHKQLRPKANVYELGTKYNLNVSLFERMVRIRGECNQLTYQHRMRPEIAKLITPSIYETLLNDKCVYDYPNVRGLDKNLFFLDHKSREETHHIDDSYLNRHEVEFLVAFAKHLLMQGYSSEDITIACTYTGQMFALMNETKNHSLLRNVRVTTVDNYQGEESKIFLLSLVRNNGEGNIGFLKEENRVCVALSRAKEGLYIMGNMDDLLVKNEIWPKIKKVLEESNAIGDSLTLRCQIHADQCFEARKADDFKQAPEGGCMKECGVLLPCSHICTNVCHVLDREHQQYRCKQKCVKSCDNDHPCNLLCWQECEPCLVKVERTPKCGHTIEMPCSFEADLFPCPVEVEVTLPDCNHNVKKLCYVSLEMVDCSFDCEIRLECGHACLKKCHANVDPDHLNYECSKECTRKNVDCTGDHSCTKRCYEKCDRCPVLVDKVRSCKHLHKNVACSLNIEDVFCSVKVKKLSSCGHTIEVKCSEEATPSKCDGNCNKTLPCGHMCTKRCNEVCTQNCKVMVPLGKPGLCGHVFSVPCFLSTDPKNRNLLKYCNHPCNVELACSHLCKGNCGSCLQGRMHVACSEPCRNVFICGHSCKVACNAECLPCTQKCNVRCGHSKCGRRCGVPCVPCKEKCRRKCEHQSCKKRCHEICDIEPCSAPCKKKLKCSHACVGFCGDPCPFLCRVCDKDELTEILFGNEENPNARFVLLPDCKHVIESEGLMQWVRPAKDEFMEVKAPVCPKCNTPIKSCTRLMNFIKEDLKNITAVKEKLFYNNKTDLVERQKKYFMQLSTLENDKTIKEFFDLRNYIQHLKTFGGPERNKKRQHLSFNEVNSFENILDLLIEMSSVLKKIKKNKISFELIKCQVEILVEALKISKLHISKQRLDDIQLELRRLHLMVTVYNIFSENKWATTQIEQEYQLLMSKLLDVRRFTRDVETEIISSSKELQNKNKTALIERTEVVKAMGLTIGHWFKCRNGHFYAIGDCGGATERSRCIECKAVVGGAHHQLEQSNALATEIDGATAPAWPTALNR